MYATFPTGISRDGLRYKSTGIYNYVYIVSESRATAGREVAPLRQNIYLPGMADGLPQLRKSYSYPILVPGNPI